MGVTSKRARHNSDPNRLSPMLGYFVALGVQEMGGLRRWAGFQHSSTLLNISQVAAE